MKIFNLFNLYKYCILCMVYFEILKKNRKVLVKIDHFLRYWNETKFCGTICYEKDQTICQDIVVRNITGEHVLVRIIQQVEQSYIQVAHLLIPFEQLGSWHPPFFLIYSSLVQLVFQHYTHTNTSQINVYVCNHFLCFCAGRV